MPILGLLRRSRRVWVSSRPHARRARVLGLEPLEGRRLLATASAQAGAWEVVVETRQAGPGNTDIVASLFRGGRLVRGDIVVTDSGRDDDDPDVSINGNGRFVVAWEREQDSSDSDIQYRAFNDRGRALTGVRTVADGSRDQQDPAVHINDSGRFVVAWRERVGGSDTDVRARGYRPKTASGSTYTTQSFRVADGDHDERNPSVFLAANGSFAVSYTREREKTGQDVRVTIFTSSSRRTRTVADTEAEENGGRIEAFDGRAGRVFYRKDGSARRKAFSI